MARKPTYSTPQPANLSSEEARAALPRLKRRLDELKTLDVVKLDPNTVDDLLDDLQRRSDDTLIGIYGAGTLDYNRYSFHTLNDTPIIIGGRGYSWSEQLGFIRSAVSSAASKLESAIRVLEERLEDAGETAGSRAVHAYQGLDLHPEIARAASRLYQDGHYSNAVEAAVKALNGLVRMRSDLEVDGSSLMERAFNPSNPILKFNALADQSDRDEQKGFMMMFSGAVAGLRNPRAHKFIQDDPERALEFIAFVSLLAKLLDVANR